MLLILPILPSPAILAIEAILTTTTFVTGATLTKTTFVIGDILFTWATLSTRDLLTIVFLLLYWSYSHYCSYYSGYLY